MTYLIYLRILKIYSMSKSLKNLVVFLLLTAGINCYADISIDSLKKDIYFMASDSMEGRYAGTKIMDQVAAHIVARFEASGIKPLKDNYFQVFPIAPHYAKNIIGYIEGSDPKLKDEFIVLGAHYDHIGWYMKDSVTKIIYPGADDNASGTAGIIEIGRMLVQNRNLLKRSVLIIAFDAEEMGLIGSNYFIKHLPVDKSKIKGMMSVDMIGWLKTGKLIFDGCGTFTFGMDLFNNIPRVDSLKVEYHDASPLWKDRTDTKPFYEQEISCMYVSTGLDSPYHKPEDSAEKIDYDGMVKVCNQIYNTTIVLAGKDEIGFTTTHEIIRTMDKSFKFGFILNYNNNHHEFSEGPFIAKALNGGGGGIFSQIALSNSFSLQPEVQYMYYGTKSKDGNIRLHSIEVPLSILLISPPGQSRVSFAFGGYYNYLLGGTIDGTKLDWIKNEYNRSDVGLSFSFGIEVFNVQLNYRFKSGFINFYKIEPKDIGKATNSQSILSLGILF